MGRCGTKAWGGGWAGGGVGLYVGVVGVDAVFGCHMGVNVLG